MNKITPEKLQQLLERARENAARALAEKNSLITFHTHESEKGITEDEEFYKEINQASTSEDKAIWDAIRSSGLESNSDQIAFCKLALSGANCILIGPAGTGKTTTQGLAARSLMSAGKLRPLHQSTKWLVEGTPGVAICSFTNKAVNNIRWRLPEDLRDNCVTIHKLLEFAPVYYEVEDKDKPGEFRKTMRFEPQRNRFNPLPSTLRLIIIEESSMVGVDLFELLMDACPHKPQLIFLGDLYQLPPIYDSSILGFKLLELPVVELKRIFRQAAESPIISLAWKIKNGETIASGTVLDPDTKRITVPSYQSLCVPDKLFIRPWQKKLSNLYALLTATKFFCLASDSGEYNPDTDIILIPYNKAFGSIELNKGIAQHLGNKRGAIVHEVIAGFNKHYLAVGDKILYAKEDHYITGIARNSSYTGKRPQLASKTLDREGHESNRKNLLALEDMNKDSIEDIENFLTAAVNKGGSPEDEERVNLASHIIEMKRCADDKEVEASSTGDVNNIIGGYAITIHKAQGSEWDKVYLILHHTHATMLQRELLYTAVTRAKKSLYVICEPNSFEKGIASQKIKGTTLAEKAEYFKGKLADKKKLEQLEMDFAKKMNAPREIKHEDLIPLVIKEETMQWFRHHWAKALEKFPNIKNRDLPGLSFNLSVNHILGRAQLKRRTIKLNPIYLAFGNKDGREDMWHDVIPHEIAHIIAWELHGCDDHGPWWQKIATMLGSDARRISSASWPLFRKAKMELLKEKFSTTETEDDEEDTIE